MSSKENLAVPTISIKVPRPGGETPRSSPLVISRMHLSEGTNKQAPDYPTRFVGPDAHLSRTLGAIAMERVARAYRIEGRPRRRSSRYATRPNCAPHPRRPAGILLADVLGMHAQLLLHDPGHWPVRPRDRCSRCHCEHGSVIRRNL